MRPICPRRGTIGTMSEAQIAEILSLPAEEQLQIIERICEHLAQTKMSIPLGVAHIKALNEAIAEYEANPDDVLTYEEFLEEIRKP